MKTILITISFALLAIAARAQCSIDFSQTNLWCNGICLGSATAMPTGASPYTYSWSTGDATALTDSLCVGTYYLTMTDDTGCIAIDSVIITEPDTFIVDANYIAGTSAPGWCDGEIGLTYSGGEIPFTVVWIDCATLVPYFFGLPGFCAGDYYCVMTDANGCVDSTECITVSDPVAGLNDFNSSQTLKIFPNPVQSEINVGSLEIDVETFQIYDLFGKLVLDEIPMGTNIDVSGLPAGQYILKLFSGENIYTARIVKE